MKRTSHRKNLTIEEEYGKEKADEIRNKIGDARIQFIKQHPEWLGKQNKKIKEAMNKQETKNKTSKTWFRIGTHNSPEYEFKKGIHCSSKTEFKKGNIPWSKGKKGVHYSPQTEFKKGHEISKKMWKDPNFQQKMFKSLNRKPTHPEQFLINFIKQHNLSFKYTGDYSFWIEGKNPDFIECNGKKLIIEFNGYYKHNEREETERAELFSKYGFRTLFLHYPDLKNETELLNKITEFLEMKL